MWFQLGVQGAALVKAILDRTLGEDLEINARGLDALLTAWQARVGPGNDGDGRRPERGAHSNHGGLVYDQAGRKAW